MRRLPRVTRVAVAGIGILAYRTVSRPVREGDLGRVECINPLEETHAYQSIYAEGKSQALERLLAHRFGPLPAWASTRIAAASIDQLDAWLDGIFDANSLEALIGPKTQC